MNLIWHDRIRETTATTGTGTITLGGAVPSYVAFSSAMSDGDVVYYYILDSTNQWESGLGTWHSGNTLARTVVLASSNSGSAINIAVGATIVTATVPADRIEAVLGHQTANLVWAGPLSGGADAPTFRALVAADLSSIALTDLHGDGTLTVSAVNGSSTVGINLAHSNTWTAAQIFAALISASSSFSFDNGKIYSDGLGHATVTNSTSPNTAPSLTVAPAGYLTSISNPLAHVGELIDVDVIGRFIALNSASCPKLQRNIVITPSYYANTTGANDSITQNIEFITFEVSGAPITIDSDFQISSPPAGGTRSTTMRLLTGSMSFNLGIGAPDNSPYTSVLALQDNNIVGAHVLLLETRGSNSTTLTCIAGNGSTSITTQAVTSGGGLTIFQAQGPGNTGITGPPTRGDFCFGIDNTQFNLSGSVSKDIMGVVITGGQNTFNNPPVYTSTSATTISTMLSPRALDVTGPSPGSNMTFTKSTTAVFRAGTLAGTLVALVGTGPTNYTGNYLEFYSKGSGTFITLQSYFDNHSGLVISPQAGSSTSTFAAQPALTINSAANTTSHASTEYNDVYINLGSATHQFSAGAISLERSILVTPRPYRFQTSASTITTAVTLAVTGAPLASTNATITNAYTVLLQAGTAAAIPLVIQGAASQTGHLLEFQDSSGNVSASFDSSYNYSGNAANVTGIVAVANGGTSSSTALSNNRVMISSGGALVERAALTTNAIIIGATSNGVAALALGTANQYLGMDTAGLTNEYKTLVAGSNVTISHGVGSTTISASGGGGGVSLVNNTDGTLTVSGSTTTTVSINLAHANTWTANQAVVGLLSASSVSFDGGTIVTNGVGNTSIGGTLALQAAYTTTRLPAFFLAPIGHANDSLASTESHVGEMTDASIALARLVVLQTATCPKLQRSFVITPPYFANSTASSDTTTAGVEFITAEITGAPITLDGDFQFGLTSRSTTMRLLTGTATVSLAGRAYDGTPLISVLVLQDNNCVAPAQTLLLETRGSHSTTLTAIDSTGASSFTTQVLTSGTPGRILTVTGPAHTGLTSWGGDVQFSLANIELNSSGSLSQRIIGLQIAGAGQGVGTGGTYSATSATTITATLSPAGLDVSGPALGTNMTFTKAAAGVFRAGALANTALALTGGGSGATPPYTGNFIEMYSSGSGGGLTLRSFFDNHSGLTLAPLAGSSTSTLAARPILTLTAPANATSAASTEFNDVYINLGSATHQFNPGALSLQRSILITPRPYKFITSASTITTAITMDIGGAPTASVNATITNKYALRILAGTAAAIPLVIQGAASQTGHLLEFQDSSGNVSASFDSSYNYSGNAANVTGIVVIANGGTNSSTTLSNNRLMISSSGAIVERAALTTNAIIIGAASNGVAALALGTANQFLGMDTAGLTNEYKTLVAGSNITINHGVGASTISASGGGGSSATTGSKTGQTTNQNIVSLVSPPAGMYEVGAYLNVNSSTTAIDIEIDYSDHAGVSQAVPMILNDPLSGATPQANIATGPFPALTHTLQTNGSGTITLRVDLNAGSANYDCYAWIRKVT